MGWCWVGLEEPCERGDAEGVHGYVLLHVVTFVEGGRQGVGFTVPRWVRCGMWESRTNYQFSLVSTCFAAPPNAGRSASTIRARLGWSCCDCSGFSLERCSRWYFWVPTRAKIPRFVAAVAGPWIVSLCCTVSARDLRPDACPELIHTLEHLLSPHL